MSRELLKKVGRTVLSKGTDLAAASAGEVIDQVKTTIKIYMYLGIAAGVLVVTVLAYGLYCLIF